MNILTTTLSASQRKIIAVVAVLLILGSLLSLFSRLATPTHKANPLPFTGLGDALAEETAKAVGDKGTVVAVIATDQTKRNTPAADQWRAFQQTLKTHTAITLVTETVPVNELGLTPTDFTALLTKHAQAAGITFLVGLPEWDPQEPITPPAGAPKVIVVHTLASVPSKQYFANSIVTTLIMARPATPGAGQPKTPRQWFEQHYQIITAENSEMLPE